MSRQYQNQYIMVGGGGGGGRLTKQWTNSATSFQQWSLRQDEMGRLIYTRVAPPKLTTEEFLDRYV